MTSPERPDLGDLRRTLLAHADDVVDHALPARLPAVHRRIRRARRRRVAAVSIAAALVVGGTGLGVALRTGDPARVDPAGPTGAATIETEVAVLGFPYRLVDQVPVTDDALDLGPAEVERAVRLSGTGLGSGTLTLVRDDVAVARVSAEYPVSVPVPVPTEGSSLRVVQDGVPATARSSLAIYQRSGLAEGVVGPSDQVLRTERAAARLVAGAWATVPRPTEVSVTAGRPVRDPEVWVYCAAPTPDLTLNLEFTDGSAVLGRCDDTGPDTYRRFGIPGVVLRGTVRAYLTQGIDGPTIDPVQAEGVVLGVGVYAATPPDQTVLGADLPPVIEYDGRTWQLGSIRNDVPRVFTVRAANGSSAPGGADRLLLGVVRGGTLSTSWAGPVADGSASDMFASQGSPATMVLGVLVGGDDYEVTASITGDGTARASIADYYPVLEPPA